MFGQSILNMVLHLQPPDYCGQRNSKHLLIWKDIPYWMVVDEEMKSFLFLFQKSNTFRNILIAFPALKFHKKALLKIIRDLSANNILLSEHTHRVSHSNDAAVLIENVAWNLTHRCNLRCQYCYYLDSLNSSNKNELSALEVISFLKTLKPLLSKHATLTVLGGEPLLEPEKLIAVCRSARQLGITPLVSTNGTLIDSAFARQARRIGLEVQISLDGPTPELNDPLRGDRTFERIEKGVSVLQSHGVKTILSMVCCRQNFGSLREFLDLAIRWNVPQCRFIPLKQIGGAKEQGLERVPHYDIVTTAWRLLKEHPEYARLLGRDCLTILANTCRQSNKKLSCGTGSQTFLLDADGLLYPCLNLNRPEFAFGHIHDNSFNFIELWKNSPHLNAVRSTVSLENPQNACSQCMVRHWCLGGCRGETQANTSQLSAHSIHCRDLRKTIEEIFWILAERPTILKSYNWVH